MRVVVTRPRAEADEWVRALRAQGYDTVELPLIDIAAAPDAAAVDLAWRELAPCRAAMFVSANAVRGFFGSHARPWPVTTRAWATGPGTRSALLAAGVPAGQVDAPGEGSTQFDSEALWKQVAAQVGRDDKVLIVRGGEGATGAPAGRDWLAGQLEAVGAQVRTCVAYVRSVPAWDASQRAIAENLAAGASWLFSSSQAIANLRDLLPTQSWDRATAIATHPRIADAAREAGFGVVCPSRPALPDVIAALESAR